MTWLLLVATPAVFALALAIPRIGRHASTVLLVAAALTSVVAAVHVLMPSAEPFFGGYLGADESTQLFAPAINFIFVGIAVNIRAHAATAPVSRRFVFLALAFLAAANLSLLSSHLMLMWIAIEATTLAAALLIVRRDAPASVVASFRFLLFSSVGLGLVPVP